MENGINVQPEGGQANPGKLSSALALTSMIMGIASIPASPCLGGILLGIPAIAIGVIALLKIKKGQASGKGMAITGICTGFAGFVVMAIVFIVAMFSGMLLPSLDSGREKARRISCASNLKIIGLGLKEYAIDWGDSFPSGKGVAGFEQLRAQNYITDTNVYVCPSTGVQPAAAGQPITDEHCSYIYLGSGRSEQDPPNTPLACDAPENHKDFGNVLFSDGHVEGFAGPDWPEKAGLRRK